MALRRHRQWCRENAYPWSPWRDALEQALLSLTNPQEPSPLDVAVAAADGAGMNTTATLAYDLDEVARLLSVSRATVERLVSGPDAELPSVKIGKARRVHRDDLDAYLDGQRKGAA